MNEIIVAWGIVIRQLKRHWFVTLFVSGVMGGGLFFFLLLYFFNHNLNGIIIKKVEESQVNLFMDIRQTPQNIQALSQQLQQYPEIASVSFVSKEKAWEAMKTEFTSQNIETAIENPLPDMFFLTLRVSALGQIAPLTQKLSSLKGVSLVQIDPAWFAYLKAFMSFQKMAFIVVASFLSAVVTFLLIYHLRFQLFECKDALKLSYQLGASRRFLRRPFVYLGLCYGVFSVFFASCFLVLLDMSQQNHVFKFIPGQLASLYTFDLPTFQDEITLFFVFVVLNTICFSYLVTTWTVRNWLKD